MSTHAKDTHLIYVLHRVTMACFYFIFLCLFFVLFFFFIQRFGITAHTLKYPFLKCIYSICLCGTLFKVKICVRTPKELQKGIQTEEVTSFLHTSINYGFFFDRRGKKKKKGKTLLPQAVK